ncbi:PIN domain nuclease [Candidatus Desantisbacteria bacterium CG_4_10_14_0_8_um_filter_48_22]|uniref:PIN domain nuclease n=1 Tax=Candidatus Desantisbacteria bacterium CG_4_10_14_0_8_um_filter_48_22 TaxID=1974543 RepID=A0A2M7S926_9BACT|nr:MAG: PIN domain nuclease [Candidatus Desantisbacteria bacterium CG_4_10_14_0_8_um_filter_48_22]
MKKKNYYFDTSIFNFMFADDAPEKREVTEKLFKILSKQAEGIFISEEVAREIGRASEPRKTQVEDLVRRVAPQMLEIDSEAEALADRYIREGIIPEKYRADAIHIAVAVINEMDVIVSWNFQHIVKLKTRTEVNGVNKLLDYSEIEICSPLEVVEP